MNFISKALVFLMFALLGPKVNVVLCFGSSECTLKCVFWAQEVL